MICTDVAHMHVDECGAPERIAGIKLLPVATADGKLTPADVRRWESRRGDEHHVQPRVVSITQATELGTVYTLDETRAIADAAHELEHVPPRRRRPPRQRRRRPSTLPLRAMTTDAGVDVVSFGGTKNGLLVGEAVVFLRPELAEDFLFTRKQLGQLASKMRFLAAQFDALLDGRPVASKRRPRQRDGRAGSPRRSTAIDGVEIAQPVEANGVFADPPGPAIDRLRAELPAANPFYVWDEAAGTVRLMCSWDTTAEDVDGLAAALETAVS